MSIYFIVRYGFVALAFIDWIVYQLVIKKKAWHTIKADAMAIAFFLLVAGGIFYWLLN
jgi:hypothetical protein